MPVAAGILVGCAPTEPCRPGSFCLDCNGTSAQMCREMVDREVEAGTWPVEE